VKGELHKHDVVYYVQVTDWGGIMTDPKLYELRVVGGGDVVIRYTQTDRPSLIEREWRSRFTARVEASPQEAWRSALRHLYRRLRETESAQIRSASALAKVGRELDLDPELPLRMDEIRECLTALLARYTPEIEESA